MPSLVSPDAVDRLLIKSRNDPARFCGCLYRVDALTASRYNAPISSMNPARFTAHGARIVFDYQTAGQMRRCHRRFPHTLREIFGAGTLYPIAPLRTA